MTRMTRLLLPFLVLALYSTASASASAATVSRGEAVIDYTDRGQGPAILLVPSLGRGRADFDDLADRLIARGFRIVAAEPRGIGGSRGPMDGLTLHDMAADLAAVLEAAGARPAVALGHAFGNTVARTLATDWPDLVQGVILVAASGRAPLSPDIRAAINNASDIALPPADRLRYLREGYFAPGNDPASWLDGWHPATQAMEWAAYRATKPDEYVPAGRTMPILDLQGDADVIIPASYSLDLQEELGSRVTVVVLPKAGHAMLPEQPAGVAEAIAGWMSRFR
jgi:pimeloyl-ACP methyl ester carboxylesterase